MTLNRLDVAVFTVVGVLLAVAAAFGFQIFVRYQYIHTGTLVTRIDRVTGRTCVMPCIAPTPPPTAAPTPTPPSLERQELRAIAQVQRNPQAQRIASRERDGYAWSAVPAAQAVKRGSVRADDAHDALVVCYCDREGFGWRWEAHLRSSETYYVNDNRVLSDRYGARLRPTRTPAPVVRIVVITPPPAPVTEAPTPEPAPVSQTQQTPSALDTVREYYRLWKQRSYSTMYAMLTPRFQAKFPYDVYVKYHTNVAEISVDAEQGYSPSVVNVRIVSRDREKDGSITQTTNAGQWELAWDGSTWKLDAQDVHEVPGSQVVVAAAPRPVSVAVPAAGGSSPSETVRRFYQLLNGSDYEAAYQLLSANFRRGGSFERWKAGYRTTIESDANVQSSNDPARVPLELVAKDRTGDRVVTHVYQGAWSLVSDGRGGWLLDEGRLRLVLTY
ncbi:MAG TPA: hypothetical protein VHS78_01325 [Candidatus Elarobacter sp.]|jgi:hypothetical protein|nr:hypothetical protein [Candidatus Elarobacter sp.]